MRASRRSAARRCEKRHCPERTVALPGGGEGRPEGLLEQVLDPVGPALGIRRVALATFAEALVQLLHQLALVLGQLDRRLHRDMAVQIAGVARAHALDALAAQAEGL